ncbi:hypothetical protein GUJ93_ZPchr0013g37040 [Zizania palustris]|uniref:Polymerase/histidinol phosphatase N-terminal domain-containing protein n=1 Tax=Zizania palustris TaxID=103762 RepID=A0A8J5WWX0_ZIZPA|nr:hypothetical protein GUJ93_ZPchr0013g37040 [Zizania palustris]
MGNRKKSKAGRSKKKPKTSADQALALDYVRAWAQRTASAPPPEPSTADAGEDFLPHQAGRMASGGGGGCGGGGGSSVLFELHSHSIHSDGFLSPSALVERAHRNGVKVLALTDHDTMAGVPEAVSAAHKFGMRIIPGVEISALYSPREIPGAGEHVHILAYYGMCGPSTDELERMLSNIRDGRLHIARAMVEVGHVENVRQAFNKYIGDDGPAYATGNEPFAETVVQLISCTGGISALAHPWALKNPDAVIRALKCAGLNALEVYRSDGKVDGFSELADKYGLLKIGGSDFHGRGGKDESDIGTVKLAITTLCCFLKMARPIWCSAMKDILLKFAEEPSVAKLEKIVKFGHHINFDGFPSMDAGMDVINLCLSSWLSNDGMEEVELEEIGLKLAHSIGKR